MPAPLSDCTVFPTGTKYLEAKACLKPRGPSSLSPWPLPRLFHFSLPEPLILCVSASMPPPLERSRLGASLGPLSPPQVPREV